MRTQKESGAIEYRPIEVPWSERAWDAQSGCWVSVAKDPDGNWAYDYATGEQTGEGSTRLEHGKGKEIGKRGKGKGKETGMKGKKKWK